MKILLVQTSFLGDVVLSTPVIGALRAEFPDAEIWMLTTPVAKQLVERDPELRGVLTFDKNGAERTIGALFRKAAELRAHGFDRAYALQRSARTAILLWLAKIPLRVGFERAKLSFLFTERRPRDQSRHDVLRNLQILGLPEDRLSNVPHALRIFPPKDEQVTAEVRDAAGAAGESVVLVPGSAWRTKMWDWRGFREVAKRLGASGRRVIVVGSGAERELAERVSVDLPAVNLAGRTTIAELDWIVARARAVICNDSMALHLASAAKVPTVAIFCATSPSFGFGPWQNEATVLELDDLPCKPCSRHGGEFCPTGTWACMRELSPDRVMQAAREVSKGL